MSKKKKITTSTGVEVRHKPLGLRIWNNRGYYLMFLPVFVFILIMYYWPMLWYSLCILRLQARRCSYFCGTQALLQYV